MYGPKQTNLYHPKEYNFAEGIIDSGNHDYPKKKLVIP